MRAVFVDTHYWVASINRIDQWHDRAMEIERQLIGAQFITTEEVLVETLNYFSSFGPQLRFKAARIVRRLLERADLKVVPQTEESFLAGVALYESRLDKGYSLTDCISMNAMREQGLTEVLTTDHHFKQEGFRVLL